MAKKGDKPTFSERLKASAKSGYESVYVSSAREGGKRKARFEKAYSSYPKTFTGRISRFANIAAIPRRERARFLSGLPPKGVERVRYAKGTSSGIRRGRGRPRGSYDQRYAKFGGVYGYRRQLSLQIAQARAEAIRRASVTPQQRLLLQQQAMQEQQEQMNPENKTIADTRGTVRLRGFHREAEDAANIFP